MVFSSIVFLFYFMPLMLIGYYLLHWFGSRHTKHAFLTLISYVFYGWANPLFFVLMLFSTLVDYVCGLGMSGQWSRSAEGRRRCRCWSPGGPALPHQTHRPGRLHLARTCCCWVSSSTSTSASTAGTP